MILYLTLAVCTLGAAVLVYRYDLYDREPVALLALAVGLGAGAMALLGWLEAVTLARIDASGPAAYAAVGALEEEALKLLVVAAMALIARRAFNDPMDGLIYGSMSGLGMALEEGVHVLRSLPRTPWLPPEELVRLCGHLVMGGIGGFGIGCAIMRAKRWPLAVAASYLAAVLLHFGWDFAALRAESSVGRRDAVLSAALMLAGLLLYGRLVAVGSCWSRQVFAPGVDSKY